MSDDIQKALDQLEKSLSFLIIPYVFSAFVVSAIVYVFSYFPSESAIPEGFLPVKKKENAIFTDGINPFEENQEKARKKIAQRVSKK